MTTHTFTDLVGCEVPIQLAGMGGIGTAELAAAVADAGGLGMVSMVLAPADLVAAELDRLTTMTSGATGINFLMPFLDPSVVDVAASRCRVVEFFYGDPDGSLVDRVHAGGALACWQVGSVAEAIAAADAGCDIVVAQGREAGGHVRGNVDLMPLLAECVANVSVPVIAAGGISTAEDVTAVMTAGACAARVGTRFVASAESDAHPDYVAAILAAHGDDTAITTTFGLGWPNATHRVLQSCIDAAEALDTDVAGETVVGETVVPMLRFLPSPPTRGTTGRVDAMALYMGQGAGKVRHVESAGDIVRDLASGAI